MTLQEAYSVLGIKAGDTQITIKRKYHALLHRYHPDTGSGSGSADATRSIVAAYKVIRSAPSTDLPASFQILPEINPSAFCARTLYARHELFEDDPADIYVRGHGAYYWDPDQEEFDLFLRSILAEARRLTQECPEKIKTVFHLLVQDYIRPLECLRKVCDEVRKETRNCSEVIVETNAEDNANSNAEDSAESNTEITFYILEGRTTEKLLDRTPCSLRGARIYAGDKLISFDDDSYYYILSMLLARKAAIVTAEPYDKSVAEPFDKSVAEPVQTDFQTRGKSTVSASSIGKRTVLTSSMGKRTSRASSMKSHRVRLAIHITNEKEAERPGNAGMYMR